MQVRRSLPKFLFSLVAIQLLGRTASAVDFKIDLPADAGRVPPTLNFKANETQKFDEELGADYNQSTVVEGNEDAGSFRLDVPESPSLALPRTEQNKTNIQEGEIANSAEKNDERNQSEPSNKLNNNASNNVTKERRNNTPNNARIADSSAKRGSGVAFPAPQCLASNVAFWERVYSETDVDDAIIHDKEDLGRIFAIVRLPRSPRQRTLMTNEVKDHVAMKLRSLASELGSPDGWDRTQRDLARLYPGNELNEATILRSIENLRVQTGLKSRFEAGIQRSLKFLPSIHDIIQDHGLPTDIVYLPHVESSYHPGARSKVGAVGLWQIMPGTMRLVMGKSSVQKRGEVNVATVAAARILQQNYKTTGSWPLALTAYNHGLHGVMRAIKKTGSRDLCQIIENYESRSFRFASSNFYAQFLAARNVAQARYLQISKREGPKTVLRELLASAQKGKL